MKRGKPLSPDRCQVCGRAFLMGSRGGQLVYYCPVCGGIRGDLEQYYAGRFRSLVQELWAEFRQVMAEEEARTLTERKE